MGQIWFKSGDSPAAVLLDPDQRYVLAPELGNGECPVGVLPDGAPLPARPVLTARRRPDRPAIWRLFVPSEQRVVVESLPVLGMRVLGHRDRIRLGSLQCCFSAADAPVPVLQTAAYSGRCSRCQGDLVAGQKVVRCPHCHRRYHEDEGSGFQCWSYRDSQGVATPCYCGYDTARTSFDWVPFRRRGGAR